MRALISGADVFNELRMTRGVFKGALFVAEGPTDCSVLDNFVDPSACKTIPAHSKDNVLEAVRLSEQASFTGVLGLVDADFDRARNRLRQSPNVCATDYHDMELTILLSGVANRMVTQYCDRQKHSRLLQMTGKTSLLELVLESASFIGLVRWTSEKLGLNLNFQSLAFPVFIDSSDLRVNQSELIRAVIGNTRSCTATPASLASELAKIMALKPDARQVASGHDVMELLSIALKRAAGQCHPSVADPRNLERMCRMAFALSDFETTAVYIWIRRWEERNAPYRVLLN